MLGNLPRSHLEAESCRGVGHLPMETRERAGGHLAAELEQEVADITGEDGLGKELAEQDFL